MMEALLIVVHGSRRADSNGALVELAARTQALGGRLVRCAFLQFGEPELAPALEELVSAGATRVTVVPLFLAAGKHVQEDIGAAVSDLRRQHPEVAVNTSPHLGVWQGLPEAILSLAEQG
jgi:sirohydrochlorin cobaltochelatase